MAVQLVVQGQERGTAPQFSRDCRDAQELPLSQQLDSCLLPRTSGPRHKPMRAEEQ